MKEAFIWSIPRSWLFNFHTSRVRIPAKATRASILFVDVMVKDCTVPFTGLCQLSSLSSSPTIIAGCASGTCSGNSEYAIGSLTKNVQMYSSASGFLAGLSSTLNGSGTVFKLVAIGTYDSTSNTFYTQRMDVALE